MDAFRSNTGPLIKTIGEGNAHMVWAIALYLEEPDVEALASAAIADVPDDKKIDFIFLDRDAKRVVFAQRDYGDGKKDSAPANKASDLNTAGAWRFSGDIDKAPPPLRSTIEECLTRSGYAATARRGCRP